MPDGLLFSCPCCRVERERLWWWLHPLHMTQQYFFASMAAWLSSTGISHHSFLPHIPSIHLSTVSSSPHPGIAPQSLNSSSWPLPLPGHPCSCLAYVWLQQGQSDSHSIYCHRSAVSLLALNVSPLTQTVALMWGSDLCFSHLLRAGPVLLTLLFYSLFPSSYWVLHGSMYSFKWQSTPALLPGKSHGRRSLIGYSPWGRKESRHNWATSLSLQFIYSFPLVRYSCLLSAGVLNALLFLRLYSRGVCGERCIPYPPTPPPSCSLQN